VHGGVKGGQMWLSGSAREFSEWGRAKLEEKFPGMRRQIEDDRDGGGGVIHVRRGKQWYVVFVFQPRFSVRAVPMWLVARLPDSEFATSMVLPQLVQQLRRVVQQIETTDAGGEAWIQAGELPADEPGSVGDFRTALALDRLPSGAAVDVTNRAILRAIQLRLQAECEAMPEDPSRLWAILRLDATGAIPSKLAGTPVQHFVLGSAVPQSRPSEFRGVADSILVRQSSPSSVLASAIRKRLASMQAKELSSFVSVPIPLLHRSAVRREEAAVWAEHIWRDAKRGEQELQDAFGGGNESLRRAVFAVTALLVRHPLARQSGVEGIEVLLRKFGLFGTASLPPSRST